MAIDALASERHFIDHLAPVWAALPPAARGDFMVPDALLAHAVGRGVEAVAPAPSGRPMLVASYGDLKRARGLRPAAIARIEHGAGQSYRSAGDHPSYPGGRDHADVELFLVPNEHAAARWHDRYPDARVEVVGCPKLETLPRRSPLPEPLTDRPVVAFAWHWACPVAPETQPALAWFAGAIPLLAVTYRLLGHAHPRKNATVLAWYRRHGIAVAPDLDEVCRRANVLVADNTSALFEFAVTGRPVVVLNAPWYRRHVHHGLRFWEAASVGVQVDDPRDLRSSIAHALEDPPEQRAQRERALDLVYTNRHGSAAIAAAESLLAWIGSDRAQERVA